MSSLSAIFFITLNSCYTHEVNTAEKWCEQILGVDLKEKYSPFWAVIFGVSFDGDAIRDDYTEFLNKVHLDQVGYRSKKMAWREGTDLHLVNLSSLMTTDSEEIISQWRRGIELAKGYKHTNPADKCLYGTLTSLFDRLVIHSMESAALGVKWKDNQTIIPTEREKKG
jgi:hypothetical protein